MAVESPVDMKAMPARLSQAKLNAEFCVRRIQNMCTPRASREKHDGDRKPGQKQHRRLLK